MTMFTRCTHCEATFRVTLEQLQTSSGQVRCGVCQNVFDAFVALSANDPRGSDDPMTIDAALPPAVAEDPPEMIADPAPQALDLELTSHDQMPREPDLVVEPEYPRPPTVVPERPAPPPPSYHDPNPRRPVERTSPFLVAFAVLLLLALALQALFIFRGDLAAALPEMRPMLEAACSEIDCEVPLPRLADRLSIEASDLQALDTARPGRVVLSATIRNRATLTQAWPMLELTLTNARDQVAARKVFTPAEYLEGADPTPGLAANAEAAVRLRLDTGDIVAAGYRIYLFHP
ncbi:MAG: zinc-ribbon and DUF3426 domain-containing protein [Burkholderiales bacterium]|nr:zinc-ribbon and DUF3426 domain-containing protein [Burkholderiales bacterium]